MLQAVEKPSSKAHQKARMDVRLLGSEGERILEEGYAYTHEGQANPPIPSHKEGKKRLLLDKDAVSILAF